MTKPTKVAILLVDNEGRDKMKTITITDSNGVEHTATVTVCRTRKARGSDTFSRSIGYRGRDCARQRFQRQTVTRLGGN